MNKRMAIGVGIGMIACLCIWGASFARNEKESPRRKDSSTDYLFQRDEIIAKCVAELEKVPSDTTALSHQAVGNICVLGRYRAKEAVGEFIRIIKMRGKMMRDDDPVADLVHLEPPSGRGPPDWEYPAVGALIEIGLLSVHAIIAEIERPGSQPDEKTIDLYAFVIHGILGDDHAKKWLLEEKRHCPEGAETNYDKLLSSKYIKFSGQKKYRRQPTSQPVVSEELSAKTSQSSGHEKCLADWATELSQAYAKNGVDGFRSKRATLQARYRDYANDDDYVVSAMMLGLGKRPWGGIAKEAELGNAVRRLCEYIEKHPGASVSQWKQLKDKIYSYSFGNGPIDESGVSVKLVTLYGIIAGETG